MARLQFSPKYMNVARITLRNWNVFWDLSCIYLHVCFIGQCIVTVLYLLKKSQATSSEDIIVVQGWNSAALFSELAIKNEYNLSNFMVFLDFYNLEKYVTANCMQRTSIQTGIRIIYQG